MNTLLLSSDEVDRAAQIIKNGGIVGMPTETVYGLAASAYDEQAIINVFKAKGRPQDNPLIVHISDFDQIYDLCSEVPDTAVKLAEKFWPGPFTMVLPKKPIVPDRVTGGNPTVAVRFSSHKICRDLIRLSGVPIAAPSANVSGYPSPTCAEHVYRDLNGKIDAIIDGGPCGCGVESTVVSLVSQPRLLRPGCVTLEQLREIVPDIIVDKALRGEISADEKVSAPGMKYRHYAPKAPVVAVCGEPEESARYILSVMKPEDLCICYEECISLFEKSGVPYGSIRNRITLAQGIFGALRTCDQKNPARIYVQCPDESDIGLAVSNRIKKSAGFNVVNV